MPLDLNRLQAKEPAIRLFIGAGDWRLPDVPFSQGDIRIEFSQAYRAFVWDGVSSGWLPRPLPSNMTHTDYLAIAHTWIEEFSARADLHRRVMLNGVSLWWLRYARLLLDRFERGQLLAFLDLLSDIAHCHPIEAVYIATDYRDKSPLVRNLLPGAKIINERETLSKPLHRALPLRRIAAQAVNAVAGGLVMATWLLRTRTDVLFFTSSHYLRRTGLATVGAKATRLEDVYSGPLSAALTDAGQRVRVVEKDMHDDVIGYSLRQRGLHYVSTRLLSGIVALRALWSRGTAQEQPDWSTIEQSALTNARYHDMSVASAVMPVLNYARTDFRRFVVFYDLWLRLLRRLQPRQIVVVCAYYFEAHAMVIAARELGIPSLELQHGIIHAHHLAYIRPPASPSLGQAGNLLVWGSTTRDLLLQHGGYRPEEVIVVGNPRIDVYLADSVGQERLVAAARRQLGIAEGVKIVLHTASPETDRFCSKAELVAALAPALREAYLVVKVHPATRDLDAWYSAFAQAGITDRAVVLREEIDLYALMLACTIHISFNSTTIIEAAALQRPNLILQFPGATDPVGYIQAGGGIGVSLPMLTAQLERLLADKDAQRNTLIAQQAFADSWCRCDGQVLKRVLGLLVE